MAVLAFEGSFPILYGSYPVPVGTGIVQGYLARPDDSGTFPAVLLLHDISGITGTEKDLARRLARRGYITLAVDLYRQRRPPSGLDAALDAYASTSDEAALIAIDEGYQFLQSEDFPWTAKPDVALVGLDVGGRFALLYAFENPAVRAVVAAYPPLGGDEDRSRRLGAVLPRLSVPVLGVFGGEDEKVPVESVDVAAQLAPGGQWLLYEGASHDFLDPDAASYHGGAASDAEARMLELLGATMPQPRPAAAG
jgi:carboxymethylenebutenolidase